MCYINKNDQGSQRDYRRSRGIGRQQNRGRGRGNYVYYADDQYHMRMMIIKMMKVMMLKMVMMEYVKLKVYYELIKVQIMMY